VRRAAARTRGHLPLAALTAALSVIAAGPARAGVLLQGYFKGVPTPGPGQNVDFWWDHLAKQAKALRESGFTAVWLPSPLKANSGTFSDGFDVFDDYDLGSKDQKQTRPTRFGTREQLERCVAILRANGLDVYVDLVENQRVGGDNKTYKYVDADGKPGGGRFAKTPTDFHGPGGVPEDPGVFDDSAQFGDDLAPINGKPPRHCFDGLLASADWLTRALDVQGFRLDDVKGVSTQFMRHLLDHGALNGKFAVGEFFDGNLGLVRNWIDDPAGMAGRASAFDFPLRFNQIQKMTNNAGFFDMSQLDHAGLAGADPFHAVTWVENHDTNEEGFLKITQNKPQAYAYILTSEGYPCVFYKDYSTDPGSFGMKPVIDNLIFIHERIADGATQQRFKSFDVFAYERLGGSHLLVGLNNNGIADRTVTVATGFGPNVVLHDYTGHAGDVRTDGGGGVTITIPKNTGGMGYVCYSRPGIAGPFPVAGQDVTQDYEGALDLDIKPADNTAFVQVCRVYVDAGRPIKGALRFGTKGWSDTTSITLEVDDPSGAKLASHVYKRATPQGEAVTANAGAVGFCTFKIRSADTPASNTRPPYTLSVTYRAPRELK
jgi:alpha-amylase